MYTLFFLFLINFIKRFFFAMLYPYFDNKLNVWISLSYLTSCMNLLSYYKKVMLSELSSFSNNFVKKWEVAKPIRSLFGVIAGKNRHETLVHRCRVNFLFQCMAAVLISWCALLMLPRFGLSFSLADYHTPHASRYALSTVDDKETLNGHL